MLKYNLLTQKISSFRYIVILSFLLTFGLAPAFAQLDFSGRWKFDKSSSSKGSMYSDYDGTVVRAIVQDAANFTYSDFYIKPGNPDWETGKEIFRLDGSQEKINGDNYIITKSTRWSGDKKSLTLSYLHTQVVNGETRDFLNEETYTLSDDRNKLTIESYSKDPVQGEKKVINNYIRN